MTATDVRPEPRRCARPGNRRATSASTGARRSRSSLLHFVPLLAIFTGVTLAAVGARASVTYFGRMFCDHGRLPPLLLAPQLPARARRRSSCSAFGGTTAAQKGPLWWAGAPPRAPQVLRHRTRHPLARAAASGGATSAGSSATSTTRPTPTTIKDFAQVPRAARGSTSTTGSGRGRSASRASSSAAGAVSVVGFFASTIAAVARDVPRELARARVRPPGRTTRPTRAGTRCSSR